MGQVVLAKDLLDQERSIAIKLLLPEYRDSTTEFMREYSVQRRLDHPAIPKVYDFGFGRHGDRDVPYFAMDYVRGIPLSSAFMQMRDPTQGYGWILQVLRALDHLHGAGFLHRDLKPSNVLVTWDSELESCAHLIDYGIAIGFGETPEELFIGTPEYSAPELMAGAPFEPRQDLYAVGLLLYELISGHRPWPGEDPTELYHKRMSEPYEPLNHESCPPALAELVDDLLKPNPSHRPASAAEVLRRYTAALSQHHLTETPLSFRRRLQTILFVGAEDFKASTQEWLGEGLGPAPSVLLIEDPAGFDGDALMHDLTDRGATAGMRVLRYHLEARAHAPLEALQPALEVLRRIREARPGASYIPEDIAGAATLLTRIQGPVILAIGSLHWADPVTFEVLNAVLTGARNPGLRIVATIDPAQSPMALAQFNRLRSLPIVRYFARQPLTRQDITQWVEKAVGCKVVPEERIDALWKLSQGKPQQVRELLSEDMRRGALIRTTDTYLWSDERALAQLAEQTGSRSIRPPSHTQLPLGAVLDGHLDDLLSILLEPVPEAVIATYLHIPSAEVRGLIAEGRLMRQPNGWAMVGPHGPSREHLHRLSATYRMSLHERLARAIELAIPFEGKSERCAREWLRSPDPLRAIPHLLEAAHRVSAPRYGDRMSRSALVLDEVAALLEHEERQLELSWRDYRQRLPTQEVPALRHEDLLRNSDDLARRFQDKRERLRQLRLDLGAARLRLARTIGDWPAWHRAASTLFERGLEVAHIPSMELALEALMQLAADRGAEDELTRYAKSLAELSAESDWALHWAKARSEANFGRPDTALTILAKAKQRQYPPERQLTLLALEAEILTQLSWHPDAENATRELSLAAQALGDRPYAMLAELLHIIRLRETFRLSEALMRGRLLSAELGDDRFYRLDGRLELELARIHVEFGSLDTAMERISQARALSKRDGDREGLLHCKLVEARILNLADQAEHALELLRHAREEAPGLSRATLRELELVELELALAVPAHLTIPLEKLYASSRRLAHGARDEGLRSLTVRGFALAARFGLAMQAGDEALACANVALEHSAAWSNVGLPRHQLLFLVARARHLRRNFFRARHLVNQARGQLHIFMASLTEISHRSAYLSAHPNQRIEAGLVEGSSPFSRRQPRIF